LPSGWEQHWDEGSGQYYFTNPTTGESTWTRPSITAITATLGDRDDDHGQQKQETAELNKKELVLEEEGRTENGTTEKKKKSRKTSSIGKWKKYTDKKRGRPFFYNKETGEKSWELPEGAAEQFEDVPTEVEDSNQNGKLTEDSNQNKLTEDLNQSSKLIEEAAKALPSGWEQYWDESSEQYYFTNPATGESTWTRPSITVMTDNMTSEAHEAKLEERADDHSDEKQQKEEAIDVSKKEVVLGDDERYEGVLSPESGVSTSEIASE